MSEEYIILNVILTDFIFNLVLLGVGITVIFGLFTRLLAMLYNEE